MNRASRFAFALSLLFIALPVQAKHQRHTSAQALAGIWGSEHAFGPGLRGRLVINGRGSPWLARIGGFDVPVRQNGRVLSLTLPDGQGEFEGRMSANRRGIRGHWVQPVTARDGFRFWTPLQLDLCQEEGVEAGNASVSKRFGRKRLLPDCFEIGKEI